jgi:hypothetical protein
MRSNRFGSSDWNTLHDGFGRCGPLRLGLLSLRSSFLPCLVRRRNEHRVRHQVPSTQRRHPLLQLPRLRALLLPRRQVLLCRQALLRFGLRCGLMPSLPGRRP